MDEQGLDICRVCRCEGTADRPLFHPCICTGSIKFIHQECLMQWLKVSDKEFCELCNYRFSFIPIYSPDMPQRLPLKDIFNVVGRCLTTIARYCFQYFLVVTAWIVLVPLLAYRIYTFLFSYNFDDILLLSSDVFKTEDLIIDGVCGSGVVLFTLGTFIFLIWLREQILRFGAPDWLERPINLNGIRRFIRLPAFNNFAIVQAEDAAVNLDAEVFEEEVLPAEAGEDDDEEDIDDDEEDEEIQEDVDGDAPNDQNQVAIAQDWNPAIEWDRVGEEITWNRILGLDGTFAFLENVFWVITLNTLFIIIFAYVPYHSGRMFLNHFQANDRDKPFVNESFDRFAIIFLGYILISGFLMVFHVLSRFTRFTRMQHCFGICYITIKVALLLLLEIGVFPTIIGWWLDICSLPLSGTTLQARINNFYSSPGSSIFFHWLIGMITIFYFVSFIFIVKETFRPGFLWFIRNLNDQNFNPVHEMIKLPVYVHFKRLIGSLVMFGTIILLALYLPLLSVQKLFPGWLLGQSMLPNESPYLFELVFQILAFRYIGPMLGEGPDFHIRDLIKACVRCWGRCVAYILDLQSYILGQPETEAQPRVNDAGNEVVQDYEKPRFFSLRVTLMIVCLFLSIFLLGLFFLTIPLRWGRMMVDKFNALQTLGEFPNNDYYAIFIGVGCLVMYIHMGNRFFSFVTNLTLVDFFTQKIFHWAGICAKLALSGILLFGVIPLMLGFLFDLIFLMPLRVSLLQTPIFSGWQDYAFGIVLTNVACVIRMSLDPRFKENVELIYLNGLPNTRLSVIIGEVAMPSIIALGLMLSVPYVAVNSILPLMSVSDKTLNWANRRIHMILFALTFCYYFGKYQISRFVSFYEHIRNDKYLVGKRLVNYDHQHRTTASATPTDAASTVETQ